METKTKREETVLAMARYSPVFGTRRRAGEMLKEINGMSQENPMRAVQVDLKGTITAPGFMDEFLKGLNEAAWPPWRPIRLTGAGDQQASLVRNIARRRNLRNISLRGLEEGQGC